MKILNMTFSDEEFETLKQQKIYSGLTWHNFLIVAGASYESLNITPENLLPLPKPKKLSEHFTSNL